MNKVFYLMIDEGIIVIGTTTMRVRDTAGKPELLARAFIEQYNFRRGTHYEFECLRKSMFIILEYPDSEDIYYEMSFIEGKKRSIIVTDLMVLLHIQKRLIVDVVKPNYGEDFARDIKLLTRATEMIVDRLENAALGKVICSKHLLIDNRNLGYVRINDLENYRKLRLERDELFESHKSISREIGSDRDSERELSKLGFPSKHWFKEIWVVYHDEKGIVKYLQIW